MTKLPPTELVKAATGNIEEKHLTKDSGMLSTFLYDGPLYDHLIDDERPEFIFKNMNKGYRITEPNGNEQTPHHDGSEGRRYLLVTDQRLLFVAGRPNGDEVIEHTYDEISDIERVDSSNIQFQTPGGETYKFAQNGVTKQTVDQAIDYISKKLTARTESEGGSGTSLTDEKQGGSDIGGESIEYTFSTWGIRIKVGDESTKIGGKTGKMSTLTITDMRVTASNPNVDGDLIFSLSLEGISDGELNAASARNPFNMKMSHTLTVYTTLEHLLVGDIGSGIKRLENDSDQSLPVEITVNFPHGTGASKEEIQESLDFISKKSEEFNTIPNKSEIFEYLDDSEELVSVTKGKELEIIQGEETESQFAGKAVYAAITDRRVMIIVGQVLTGDDVRNISYGSIDGVDIDNNFIVDYLRIYSGGRTYKINIYDINQAEEIVDYIRNKIEGPQEVVTQSEIQNEETDTETDSTKKLRELKSLHEEGILTDEEFESKKEELLDDF